MMRMLENKKELRSWQNFLANSELERLEHRVFIYALENPSATIVDDNLDHFFCKPKCAAKVNKVFGFIFKIVEDEGFR